MNYLLLYSLYLYTWSIPESSCRLEIWQSRRIENRPSRTWNEIKSAFNKLKCPLLLLKMNSPKTRGQSKYCTGLISQHTMRTSWMAHSKTSSCRYVGKQATNDTSPLGRLLSALAVVEMDENVVVDADAEPLEAAHWAESPPMRKHLVCARIKLFPAIVICFKWLYVFVNIDLLVAIIELHRSRRCITPNRLLLMLSCVFAGGLVCAVFSGIL